MKLVFLAYRSWAIAACKKAFPLAEKKFKDIKILKDPKELEGVKDSVVLGAGWSWIISEDVISDNRVIALVHPSDLPNYAGGSPIQHQIIDGIEKTTACLFKVTEDLDAGAVFLKSPLSLEGGISDIFDDLEKVTTELFCRFIETYPKISETSQEKTSLKIKKRLSPEDSRLKKSDFRDKNTKELYNLMRCREDPYPNVFIEDDVGILKFKQVSFEKKDTNDK